MVDDAGPPPTAAARAVVIAIAQSVEERVRIAELVDGSATVLLVSDVAEAVEFLRRAGRPAPRIEAVPPEPVPAVAPRPPEGLVVDPDWRTATWQGARTQLSPLEHDLLQCLLAEIGHIQTFECLQQQVWHNEHQGGRSHVQSVVKRLRRKLELIGSPFHIDAVRGVGLRLVDMRTLSVAQPPTPAATALPGPRVTHGPG